MARSASQILAFLIFVFCTTSNVGAQDAQLQELIGFMKLRESYEEQRRAAQLALDQRLSQINLDTSEIEQDNIREEALKVERFKVDMREALNTTYDWNADKKEYLAAISDLFTDDELGKLLDFMRSDIGQKYLLSINKLRQQNKILLAVKQSELSARFEKVTNEFSQQFTTAEK